MYDFRIRKTTGINRSQLYGFSLSSSRESVLVYLGAFHYAKLTGQRSVGIPEENGTIKLGQPIEMALVISNSSSGFPN